MTRVLVCGSRTWRDGEAIRADLRMIERGSTVITGGARGADQLAETIAHSLGFDVETFLADWRREGRQAGYLRNLRMLATKPDLVLAYQLDDSLGTQHVIDQAGKRGIPVRVRTGAS